ncbi:unnamed protein product, partial [Mesorhabditis spiculigera]
MEIDNELMLDECAFIVQHDWHRSLSSAPYNFFVGLKKPGQDKTKFFDAIVDPKTGDIEIERGDGSFTVALRGRALEVACASGRKTYFLAPLVEYGDVHSAPIASLDVASSGNMFLSTDSYGALRVSGTTDGRPLRELKGHMLHLTARLFPSDLVVLGGGADMRLRVWSVETCEVARTMKGHMMAITDVGILGVGREVVSCSRDGTAKKWSCAEGECVLTWAPESGECNALALNPAGSLIAVACSLNKIAVYPIDSSEMVFSASVSGSPSTLSFSPCGARIACGDDQGHLSIYNATNGSRVALLRTTRGNIEKLKWRNAGIFVCFHDGSVGLYDSVNFRDHPKYELSGPDCDPVYDIAFNQDIIYTGSRDKLIRNMLSKDLLRARPLFNITSRGKRNRFKPKIASVRQNKNPSSMALDHFDFYYGPIFGKKWPSIRLGLLMPNQYVAVVNTLSKSWKANVLLLEEEGAVDLLEKIQGKFRDKRQEDKIREMSQGAKKDADRLLRENQEPGTSLDRNFALRETDEMRGEAGLKEFASSPGEFSQYDQQLGLKFTEEQKLKDIQVTGFEGDGLELPIRKHALKYPKDLRIRTMQRGDISRYPPPLKDSDAVPGWWLLDGGSVVPVLALNFEQDDTFLDLCAAPGGKSLLSLLTGLPKKIVCNDYKLARLGDLKRSLSLYVPADSPAAEKVILKRKDASDVAGWDEIEAYDKVLADVPCSSDRLSVSQDEGTLFELQHTQKRLDLPQLQTKILVNALRSAKKGGSVVYSTCTLSPAQNEAVVQNAVAIAEQQFGIRVVEESLTLLKRHLELTGLFRFANNTQHGLLLLPFIPSNFGPMYICKLHRLL